MSDLPVQGSVVASNNVQAGKVVSAIQNVDAGHDVTAVNNVIAGQNIIAGNIVSASRDIGAGRNIVAQNDVVAGNNVSAQNVIAQIGVTAANVNTYTLHSNYNVTAKTNMGVFDIPLNWGGKAKTIWVNDTGNPPTQPGLFLRDFYGYTWVLYIDTSDATVGPTLGLVRLS